MSAVVDDRVLRDLLLAAVARHRRRTALVVGGEPVTYGELETAAWAVAGHLDDLGVGPGSPVGIALRNGLEYVVADLAVALLGAAKVPMNLMLSDEEKAYVLDDSGAVVCFVEHDGLGALELAARDGATPALVVVGDETSTRSWDAAVAHAPLDRLPDVPADALALIMYTGGTTGRPKGVLHTQRGIVANLLSHVIEMELVAEDRLLLTSPLPHSAGFLLQAALTKGATVLLEDGFDLEVVLDRIETDRASYLFLVPTMIYRLLDAVAARPGFDSGSVRTILYGAAPITVERLEEGLRTFGPVFVQLYAQSEAPNFLTRLRRDDHRLDGDARRLASCGQSVVMARVEIRGKDGSPCGVGEVGEVVALSPYTMTGYLNREPETAEALRDGWLHTGDLGYLDDDGYLFLVDRKKDMIITGGLNVYSSEVEQAIARVPGVREVAVTGVPHPDWGEAVVAFVVADDTALSGQGVQDAVRATLSAYKRPKRVEVVPALPVTAVGKIDKKRLRHEWQEAW